jgi:hypothetical protein
MIINLGPLLSALPVHKTTVYFEHYVCENITIITSLNEKSYM